MQQIKIIKGTYGYKPKGSRRIKPVSTGCTVIVPDDEAVRLVGLGVARIIQDAPASGVATPGEGNAKTAPGATTPGNKNGFTPQEPGESEVHPSEGIAIPETLDVVDDHFTKESLLQMTRTDLERLATDLGVDVSKCKNKGEIADILASVELEEAQIINKEEVPPDLSTEDPVT